jgi:hypothetical protein
MYPDGAVLYLQIAPANTKSRIFKFTLSGRAREMGLGPYPRISRADARERRDDARRLPLDGLDPIAAASGGAVIGVRASADDR